MFAMTRRRSPWRDFGTAAGITPPRPDEVVPPREAYQDARQGW